jgi:RHS repeat-associated protein
MNRDYRKNLDFTYNLLNLPYQVKQQDTVRATYTYLADGAKLAATADTIVAGAISLHGDIVYVTQRKGFDYFGSLVYTNNNGIRTLESTSFGGGRINRTGTNAYDINYFITDHLGSTRVIVDNNGIIKEQKDFYPFGKEHENSSLMSSTNRWSFNGKEKQTIKDLGWLDFSARMYDSDIGRWFVQDLLQEKKPWISSYNYCLNNPLKYVDPNGMAEWEFSYIQMQIGDKTFEVPHWERISDTGDDMEVDFVHTNEVDEDGSQLTYIYDREGNSNIMKDGRRYLKGGTKRNKDVNWWTIFSEWTNGDGPIRSIFEGEHPSITEGILKDLKYVSELQEFVKSNKMKSNTAIRFGALGILLAHDNMQLQMMGSYNVSFYKLGDKILSIALDSKSRTSYYLHLPFVNNYERSHEKTRQGNTYQVYMFLLK